MDKRFYMINSVQKNSLFYLRSFLPKLAGMRVHLALSRENLFLVVSFCLLLNIVMLSSASAHTPASENYSSNIGASKKTQNVRFCADPDWMPFEGIINNKHTGIASEYLEIFSQLTPLSFELVPTSSWQQSTEFLQTGLCELTLMLNHSPEREKYLSFTMPYFFGPNVLVTKKNRAFLQDLSSIGNARLGIVQGYRLQEEISRYYPTIKLVEMSSEVAGLKALDNGVIDVYVGSMFSVNARLNQLGLQSLRINGWISIQDALRIGVAKEHSALVPILNQAIEQISARQHNDILNRWSNVKIVRETDYTMVYRVLAVAFLIIFAFMWRFFTARKVAQAMQNKNAELEKTRQALIDANKNLEYISFHDNLTELYNRHYFLSTLQHHVNNLMRDNKYSAMLMIDIDHFKQINDSFGHSIGDDVLKQFSQILLHSVRSGDIAARWGGEEFAVLLPQANLETAAILAERVRQNVVAAEFCQGITVTISVGVSLYQAKEKIAAWIERTDSALYQAKHQGRNRIQVTA